MGKSSAFNLQDGGLYYGNLNSKGLPDSLDSIGMWDDGRRYIGQWVNGRVHGVGTMYYPDGSVIRGFWYNNELLHTFDNQVPISHLPKNKNDIFFPHLQIFCSGQCSSANCLSYFPFISPALVSSYKHFFVVLMLVR